MRRIFIFAAGALLLPALAMGQGASTTAQDSTKQIRSFDVEAMDKTVDPCTDFYQFACGSWRKANPIPADRGAYSRFAELDDNNHFVLRDILNQISANDPKRDANDTKVGDYYASCIDEAAINKKGLAPLQPELAKIAAIKSKSDLPKYLGDAQLFGTRAFFNFGSEPDAKDAKMTIAGTGQGGLGLPDRDYYFRDDAKSVALREAYVAHVANMFKLAGDSPEVAAAKAKTVMRIETALAKNSLDRTSRRNPDNVFHKLSVKDLAAMSPAFDWNQYFVASGAPKFDALNVAEPEFFKTMNQVIASESLADLKTYMSWHVLTLAAPFLPKDFVDENFNFYGKQLTGAKELRPRWRRCVNFTDGDIGEALGKAYVKRNFPPEAKQHMLEMIHQLEASLGEDIQGLPWMTDTTKQQALVKLKAIAEKIGYPDKWRDYSSLKIVRGDALGNSLRANIFESKRQLAKIGKPVDRSEWGMTPPTVNAYYNPLENNINFPAGILQPPFFDAKGDDATNFGAIVAVIGHEATHGFDDEGRRFDAEGNLRDWWTAEDGKAFEERAQCIVNEYGNFVAVDDVHLNGKLTLGENAADNGGLRVAYMSLKKAIKDDQAIKGFTPDQRFFIGWAQVWCENVRPESSRSQALSNEHSPGQFRVNGVVSNMPEFQKAYNCKADAKMVNAKACRVW
jgi:endothelin-converting enzyme/putative endopeptidase